jgi:hypothetical protein
MRATLNDLDALSAISTASVHAYLRSQKWQEFKNFGDRGVVYGLNDNFEVFAPGSQQLADYAESVSRVISVVARAEERDELAVYRDLVSADRDLIRFRAPDADDDGSIDLDLGVDLVHQCRDALLAAACSASAPKRFYRSGSNTKATEYLKTVKLGQTEHGSFVVTMLSPVPPYLELTGQQVLSPEFAEEPFERQVTRTLSVATNAVKTAISEVSRGGNIEAFERVVAKGVSANLCAAIAKFVSDGRGLDFSLSWARTRPASEVRARTEFVPSDAAILTEAAKVLREKEPRQNERLFGFVTRLAREPDAKEGRVSVSAFVDGKPAAVSVVLDEALYTVALSAHRDGAEFILEGDLERSGQRWVLNRPRNPEVHKIEFEDGEIQAPSETIPKG